jgi:hypothetical protein
LGCDSLVTLNLTINQPTTSTQNVTTCENYAWNGQVYTQSGTYTYTTSNAAGCDSTVTLHLIINYGTRQAQTISSCQSYLWNGISYLNSGTYLYSYTNNSGCPSADTLHLTILPLPNAPVLFVTQPTLGIMTGSIQITSPLGAGNQYSINGTNYQSGSLFSNLAPGNYSVTVKSLAGCVSPSIFVAISGSTQCGIYHTNTSCSDFNNNRGELVDQMCYSSNAGVVTNVTPGKIFYYTKLVAPSSSFCVEVLQTNAVSGFNLMTIHQENQISLYESGCFRVATGVMYTLGNGRICISNAIAGTTYILSVKYDPKSIIGSILPGSPSVCMYGMESRINGVLVQGSQTSIALTPDCNSESRNPNYWRANISENPTTNNFILNVTTDDDQKIMVRVFDVLGRVMDRFEMRPNEQLLRGSMLSRGVYFFEFTQGANRKVLKAEKM